MVMRFETRLIIRFLVIILSCLKVKGIQTMDNGLLDDMFQEYAHNSLPTHPLTGLLYNASLPSNFTGIQLSIVRLRWDSFWGKGANYSGFNMPPRIFAHPYFTRLDIVYSNIGNQSSYYNNYNVPDHTLVAPVLGFNVYGSGGQIGNLTTPVTKLNLTLFGGPILIQFPSISQAKCVTFYPNGTFEMINMTRQDMMCPVLDQGHFSLVVQGQTPPEDDDKGRRRELWKWWVFGFAIGVLGLLFIGFIGFMIIRMRNIEKMEREAEKNETLDITNVGGSKMPLATIVRTQPVIENEYVP
ncbi:hypothetical protein L1987_03363 [Smallanthus sonchifolius]|uniref:Uncharacterized protein n=1 Tax=Smallanthus sonchifolius TaxID=185202 RepID=A0ACB9KAD8_9ASTR|nr:hypothetical protein L1987_03363 [Smallanthus sonchifolius]